MIGIYKITNKLNKKSYIGQSIHCGKRLDEHYKGDQLIDSIIQIEGIENFNFEILKEVEKDKLSYWEDYYIIKYNTMFPNGYNKKWNCNYSIREKIYNKIEKEKKEEERIKKKEENQSLKIVQNEENVKYQKCKKEGSIKFQHDEENVKSFLDNESVEKDNLPIVSEEEKVRDNCMRLYTYLVTLSIPDFSNPSSRRKGRRQFQQKDFTLNKIHNVLGIDPKTIKKYWYQLELDGLIKYVGGAPVDEELSWEKNFMNRKKYPEGFYHIDRPEKFRKIPKETVTKILKDYLVSEMELKLYLMLGNVQEYYYSRNIQNIQVTYKDLITLLGMKNEKANRVAIRKALVWLKEINLIKFEYTKRKAGNFNFEIECINLIQVNFYIDPSHVNIDNSNYEIISQYDKEEIIKMSLEQDI